MLRTKIYLITAGLVALIVISLSGAVMAQTGQIRCGVNAAAGTSGCGGPAGGAARTINGRIGTIVNILSSLVGVLAVIMIIIGGFRYITSAGDSNKVGGAKNTIIYALIGLAIVALAQVLVRFVLHIAT